MPTLEAVIKNNIHYISCNDGEEDSLNQLIQKFRAKVDELSSALPNADDKTLYLVAGLMFLDKLEEQKPDTTADTNHNLKHEEQTAMQFTSTIDKLTETIEGLTAKLAKSSIV